MTTATNPIDARTGGAAAALRHLADIAHAAAVRARQDRLESIRTGRLLGRAAHAEGHAQGVEDVLRWLAGDEPSEMLARALSARPAT